MPGPDCLFDRLDLTQQVARLDDIRIILHLERRVRWTDLRHPLDLRSTDRGGDREALEKSVERHRLVAFDEDVLVASIGIPAGHRMLSSFMTAFDTSLRRATVLANECGSLPRGRPAPLQASGGATASCLCLRRSIRKARVADEKAPSRGFRPRR